MRIWKKGCKDFIENSLKLFRNINNRITEEHFILFQQKGIRARNNNRYVYSILAEPSDKIRIREYALDNETVALLKEFENKAKFKTKNYVIFHHRKHNGSITVKSQDHKHAFLFKILDKNSEETSKKFRVIKDSDGGYYFKRNDFMTKLEVEDTIKELVSKYLKLYEKTAN